MFISDDRMTKSFIITQDGEYEVHQIGVINDLRINVRINVYRIEALETTSFSYIVEKNITTIMDSCFTIIRINIDKSAEISEHSSANWVAMLENGKLLVALSIVAIAIGIAVVFWAVYGARSDKLKASQS